jgi:hypothetical protein
MVRPNNSNPAAYLGGGFHEGLASLRGPLGIIPTLTAPRMPRKVTSTNNLASAIPQTGKPSAHPPQWRVFATCRRTEEASRVVGHPRRSHSCSLRTRSFRP